MRTSDERKGHLDHILRLLIEVQLVRLDIRVPSSLVEVGLDHLQERGTVGREARSRTVQQAGVEG